MMFIQIFTACAFYDIQNAMKIHTHAIKMSIPHTSMLFILFYIKLLQNNSLKSLQHLTCLSLQFLSKLTCCATSLCDLPDESSCNTMISRLAGGKNAKHRVLTLKVLVATIDAQWEGMGDVGSARYKPALLPPCTTISVLSYSN